MWSIYIIVDITSCAQTNLLLRLTCDPPHKRLPNLLDLNLPRRRMLPVQPSWDSPLPLCTDVWRPSSSSWWWWCLRCVEHELPIIWFRWCEFLHSLQLFSCIPAAQPMSMHGYLLLCRWIWVDGKKGSKCSLLNLPTELFCVWNKQQTFALREERAALWRRNETQQLQHRLLTMNNNGSERRREVCLLLHLAASMVPMLNSQKSSSVTEAKVPTC